MGSNGADSSDVYLFPASFAQRRLWFLDQLAPGNAFYNLHAAIGLAFDVDVRAFERSLNDIVRRHEALRTAFAVVGGEPYQAVAADLLLELPVDDVGALDDDALRRIATAEATAPFDLASPPLMRARLVRQAARAWTFLLTMHHTISDGWSVGLLLQELDALYTAHSRGLAPALAELPIQYGDYAVWQRDRLRGEALEDEVEHWRERLRDAPVLQLPTDRPRPAVQSFRGASEALSVPGAVRDGLQALGRSHDATLFMVLLAAFTTLLQRYSGQDDLVIGLPMAGRGHHLVERLIGFFINSVVVRADLSGDPPFGELVGRVREATLTSFEHQDLPFEKLVEELHIERDLSRNPVYQVTFQLINAPTLGSPNGAGRPRGGEPATRHDVERGTAMFDLAFDLIETPDGLAGRVEYSTDLFGAETVAGMARHFEALLAHVVDDPHRRLSELTPAAPHEADLRGEETRWDGPALLHELVAEQAARTPDAVAVEADDGTSLTYAQLARRMHQLARLLSARGVRAGSLVGVCMERSPALVVALLGVLEAGAAYVPLDPGEPPARLEAMARETNAVLADPGRSAGPRVIELDGAFAALRRRSGEPPPCAAGPDDLAYVIHTSGSTGAPKGVMVSHRAACNHMRWMQRDLPLRPEDRVLQRTPLGFDASVWELFAPLTTGARLVLAPPGADGDPSRLVDLVRRREITVLQLVPSLLALLLEEPGVDGCRSLRRVCSGGEPLAAELGDRCLATLPATLVNLYGPTEATIDALAWTAEPGDDRPTVPIGRPIANCRAYVLDRRLRPVPRGVPGELCLAGDVLARGYLGDPARTAERFVPDPFTPSPGARMYRTGDRVRELPGGALEYLGRTDRQVKLRGVRIEPAEIEAILHEHAGVRQAAVAVREDAPGDRRLAAYAAVADGGPDAQALRAFLRSRLPERMVPSHVLVLDHLPLTANGKVDHAALARLRPAAPAAAGQVPPRTALEQALAALWADVVGVEPVGVQDDFFNDLGGHSLLATQLLARVRELLTVEVPLQRIFEAPTIEAFAASLMDDEAVAARSQRAAELFLRVHAMSDEEVEAMLAGGLES